MIYALDGIVIFLVCLIVLAAYWKRNHTSPKYMALTTKVLSFLAALAATGFLYLVASGEQEYIHLVVSIAWLIPALRGIYRIAQDSD